MIIALGTTPALQRTMFFTRFTTDAVNRAEESIESAAGKYINVARLCRLLGLDVRAVGFLGGETGRIIREDLQARGVICDLVETPFPTRTCTTIIDRSTGQITELVEESQPVADELWKELLGRLEAALPTARMLVCSGSLPRQGPPDFFVHCMELANRFQVPVIVDSQGEPLRRALACKPLLVKPNREELAATLNIPIESDAALRAAVRQLIAAGPQWAIITQGADGMLISDGKRFWHIAGPRVKVVNPIGSGDSVTAGVVAGLLQGLEMPQAAALGAACGAANVLTPVSGLFHMKDVARLRKAVTIEEVKW